MRKLRRKILRAKAVKEQTGYSRVQVWRKSRDPDDDFPAPVQLGPNSIGWHEDEIETWIASRPRVNWASRATPDHHEPDAAESDPGRKPQFGRRWTEPPHCDGSSNKAKTKGVP